MANYDNIKPYADFAHEAAEHGGVEAYLDIIADANYNQGVMDEQGAELEKAALVVVIAITAWEIGKAGCRGIREMHRKRKAKRTMLTRQAEAAKRMVIETAAKNGVPVESRTQS